MSEALFFHYMIMSYKFASQSYNFSKFCVQFLSLKYWQYLSLIAFITNFCTTILKICLSFYAASWIFWIEFDSQRDQLLGKAYWLITKLFSNLLQFFRSQCEFLMSTWNIQSLHSWDDITQRRNPWFWAGVKGQFALTEEWFQAGDKPGTHPHSLSKFRSDDPNSITFCSVNNVQGSAM